MSTVALSNVSETDKAAVFRYFGHFPSKCCNLRARTAFTGQNGVIVA
jgi:hypothetical protein